MESAQSPQSPEITSVNDDTPPVSAVERDANYEGDVPHFKDATYDVAPRGIVAFLALMLAFYILYWIIVWTEIFILRGA